MPSFSIHSLDLLQTCDGRIQEVFEEIIKTIDCRVISGRRDKAEQDELYRTGKSQLMFANSYHNTSPLSKAIDIVPYPVDWQDRERMTLFAGAVLMCAKMKGYKFTWGGDWNGDWSVKDNKFDDFAHFQVEEQ